MSGYYVIGDHCKHAQMDLTKIETQTGTA